MQEDLQRKAANGGWADFHEPGEEDYEPSPVVDLNTEISADNVGYKLLQKMGWARGKGLGRNEDGKKMPGY
jgi:hypothetical protein